MTATRMVVEIVWVAGKASSYMLAGRAPVLNRQHTTRPKYLPSKQLIHYSHGNPLVRLCRYQ
jgi:hypothetical protein